MPGVWLSLTYRRPAILADSGAWSCAFARTSVLIRRVATIFRREAACKARQAPGSFGISGAVEQKALHVYHPNMRTRLWTAIGFACGAALSVPASTQTPARYDVLIRNGRVLDGSGNPWLAADIGVRGGRIVDMGRLGNAAAAQVIDASRLTVAPGFIDVHSHASQGLEGALKEARQLIAQGITTVALNPDGGGTTDLRAQRAGFEQRGVGVNVALYVPHGSIRREVLGMADRAPNAQELERMTQLARRGMEAGGIGLSSGLYYAPGSYATTEEVIALAKIVGELGGVYESHIRD